MRLSALLVAGGGLAVAVMLIAGTGMRSPVAPPSADPAQEIRHSAPPLAIASPEPVATPEQASPAAVETPPQRPVVSRPVAPTIVAIPPVDPQTLERIAPRAPLSDIAQALPLKKPRPKPLMFRPVAESASVISAGGYTITIAGIDPVAFDETCTSDTGKVWPCGRAARAAFRGFLRGRAVSCEFPEGEVPDAVTASCRLGTYDIGGWLVANGWARSDGDIYAEPADVARRAGKGIYGPGPATLPDDFNARLALPDGLGPVAGQDGQDISILPDPSLADDVSPAAPPAQP